MRPPLAPVRVDAGLAEETGRVKFDGDNKVLLPKAVYKDVDGLKNYHIYNQYIIRTEKRDELRELQRVSKGEGEG